MINFRFHLVSLIAVFLALGLGILVGSTVIDQGIVNRLDSEINNVRKENKAARGHEQAAGEAELTASAVRQPGRPVRRRRPARAGLRRARRRARGSEQRGQAHPAGVARGRRRRARSAVARRFVAPRLRRAGAGAAVGARAEGRRVEQRGSALDLLVRRLAKAPATSTTTTTTRRTSGSEAGAVDVGRANHDVVDARPQERPTC